MSIRERKAYELNKNIEALSLKAPLAFFDIDGTLTKGFTIISFAEYLTNQGIFEPSYWQQMQIDLLAYQGSDKDESAYRKFAITLVEHYALGLEGRPVEETELHGELFFDQALDGKIKDYRILTFAQELVNQMRKLGRTIAVSGSPVEPLLPLKRFLSFDELRATTLEIANGYFTGQVVDNLAIGVAKSKVVGGYLRDGIDIERSFAFGDSLHDVPILEAVGNPFVLGSNEGLQELGRSRGWFVISDGNEIIEVVKNQINLLFDEE